MPAASVQLQLPESFQHYRIDTCVFNIALLRVYQVWDTKLHRAVLMYIIRTQTEATLETRAALETQSNHDEECLLGYLQRARRAAALQHSAFIRIHALEEFDQQLILITEAVQDLLHPIASVYSTSQENSCDANNLSASSESLSLQHAVPPLRQLMQLATAMQEAHAVGLVHGDLRIANLMLDSAGMLRIPSVGLVLHHARMTHDDVTGLSDAQYQDVYSLGLLLFELLTEQVPDQSIWTLQDKQFPWPEGIAKELRRFIIAMTDATQEYRLTCSDVVERCRDLNVAESSSATYVNGLLLKQELQRIQRHRQRRFVMIGVIVAVVGVVGGWQAQSYFPKLGRYLAPYAESREMAQAARDLTEYTYKTDAKLLDSAEGHLMKVLAHQSDHAGAVAYMSVLYLSKYNTEKRDETWFQKAKASAQQAMALDSSLAISMIAQAKILQWHHQHEPALSLVVKARVLDPENLLAWQTQVSILLEMRRYPEAISLAQLGSHRFPQDRFMLDLQAGMYISDKKFREAEQALRLSIQRQPDSPLAYSLLAESLSSQGRDADALQAIQQGLQVRPSANLYGALGNVQFRRGEYVAASEAFARAVSRDKGIAGSYLRWFEYAESLVWVNGRAADVALAHQRASELLDIRLNRSPDDETLLSIKSVILARLKQFPQSKQFANRAIARQSDDPYVHYNLAIAYELMDERELALKELGLSKQYGILNQQLENNPNLKELRRDPRYLNL